MNEKIHAIADFYGYENQSLQLIEEMAELTVAISHVRRECKKNGCWPEQTKSYDNLVEELADVMLCLDQIIYLLQVDPDDMVAAKVKRQIERINSRT